MKKKEVKSINEVKKQHGEDYKKDFPRLAKYKMVLSNDEDVVDGQRS